MKDAVRERFSLGDGVGSWKSKAEEGTKKIAGPAFYVSMYGAPAEAALLASALLQNGGRLALLPDGEARIERLLEKRIRAGGRAARGTPFPGPPLRSSPR